MMTAAQALDFRRPLKSSPAIESWIHDYRKQVSFVKKDRIFYKDIEKTKGFLFQ
jgi:histidine ammonia-lyase